MKVHNDKNKEEPRDTVGASSHDQDKAVDQCKGEDNGQDNGVERDNGMAHDQEGAKDEDAEATDQDKHGASGTGGMQPEEGSGVSSGADGDVATRNKEESQMLTALVNAAIEEANLLTEQATPS